MMNSGEKLDKFIDLERGFKRESMESKNTEFGSRFTEKSKSEKDINFKMRKFWKTEIKIKIN